MPHHPTPLKFLMPAWFVPVMGLSGLALAWHNATFLMGEAARTAALLLAGLAGLLALLLSVLTVLRRQRYPAALAEDMAHPVRHVFMATMPICLLLLATLATTLVGPSLPVQAVWLVGSVWQLGLTLWVLSRWLQPGVGGKAEGASFWPAMTPALLIPVVGNVLAPLAGGALGFAGWSAAQFGVGVFLWPVVITLLAVRIGISGLWPDRLLPTTFITVAPPAVIGLGLLVLNAPTPLAWGAWGVSLFFLAWSTRVFKRVMTQPFAITFWALSFPMAAFSALTLRLAKDANGSFQMLAVALLAMTSLLILALLMATVKGLREGHLLAPEPVASIHTVAA